MTKAKKPSVNTITNCVVSNGAISHNEHSAAMAVKLSEAVIKNAEAVIENAKALQKIAKSVSFKGVEQEFGPAISIGTN